VELRELWLSEKKTTMDVENMKGKQEGMKEDGQ
jgi:hypothetical protein